ncbi:hypothetical protein EST38_g6824 [Candolleomyces aberdarensis]|uniref:Uncharacterized protein n=1 Tax=Candolleomyces aberdarensis TaxID=2316362 RepID=A0A4Q2DJL7_9AGAR|nr:hypothetical protein EST38_g6824 [Candolleomyces aberdarensis]
MKRSRLLSSEERTSKVARTEKIGWTRTFAVNSDSGFYLPDEPRPTPPQLESDPQDDKVSRAGKKFADTVFTRMMVGWRPLDDNDISTYDQAHSLTSKYAFMVAFKHTLKCLLQEAYNKRQAADEAGLKNLLKDIESRNLDNTVFSMFLNTIEKDTGKHKYWEPILDMAKNRRKRLQRMMRAGRTLRKGATFVGVEKVPESEQHLLRGKKLLELAEFAEVGLQSGVLSNDGDNANYVVLNEAVHRICAPLAGEATGARGIILWSKEGPDDTVVTSQKIFGGVIYNIKQLVGEFSPDEEPVHMRTSNTNMEGLKSMGKTPAPLPCKAYNAVRFF